MSPHPLKLLSAYLDGELDGAAHGAVTEHLQTCPACVARLAELAAVDHAVRGLEVDAPAGYFDTFGARLRQRLPTRRRLAAPWWWAAAAAALLVGVVTPILLRQPELHAPAPAPPVPAPRPRAAAEQEASGAAGRMLEQQSRTASGTRRDAPADQSHARPEAKKATAGPVGELQATPDGLRPPERAAEPSESGTEDTVVAKPRLAEAVPPRPQPLQPPATGFAAAPPVRQKDGDAAAQAALAGAPPPERDEKGAPPPAAAAAPVSTDKTASAQEKRGERSGVGSVPRDRTRFTELSSQPVGSAEDARALREAWRDFAQRYAQSPLADEARVRVISSGRDAYQRSGEARDLSQLRRDAAAYLERRDAAQAARVRALLESVR